MSEFGLEFEAYADRSASVGKLGIVLSEFQGLSTPQTLSKSDAPCFSWHFVLSDSPDRAVDNRNLPPKASVTVILSEIREYFQRRGVDGYLQLRDYFLDLERKVSSEGKFDREDLKEALINFGLPVDIKYLDVLINLVDKKQLDLIDWREFIRVLRGELSRNRRSLLEDIFNHLDVKRIGVIPFETLSRNFNGRGHPLVKECGFSEEEALAHLLNSFRARGGKELRMATLEAFVDYYADLGDSYTNDYEFEEFVKNNWKNNL